MTRQLPPAFHFSQSSLQDFVDCARRFQLRYLMEQDYPAPAAEPLMATEDAAELGKRFHLRMERYWRGAPLPPLDWASPLGRWWAAFEANPPPNIPSTHRRPEITLSARLGDQRFTATFDLLAYDADGTVVILDWKTSKRTPLKLLNRRLQTILYPLLFVEASAGLIGRHVAPEQVQLVYWFAEDGGATETFSYNAERMDEDRRYLDAVITRLLTLDVTVFPLTENERLCRLCQYRSLCGRGVKAGGIDEIAETYPDVDELRGVLAVDADSQDFVL
ncbi:MAG TPA: PD-(D/E)XK nuclease family protein [Aggregatilineales bacterium]|nr:PD-(D/E)XK nuclease family protein [Anaerolineales bacterium]HRE47235.1 PD-(D/E)XK nuclease family protein [Aggregatilineales bacterium]